MVEENEKSVLADYNIKDEEIRLIKFSNLNVLIGKNNSGKSRFMRDLLNEKLDNKCIADKIMTELEINRHIREFEVKLQNKFGMNNQYSDVESYFEGEYLGDFLTLGKMINYYKVYENTEYTSEVEKITELYEVAKEIKNKGGTKRLYIPILRGLRGLNFEKDVSFKTYIDVKNKENLVAEINKKDHYGERTRKDYHVKTNVEIITGLNFYEDIKRSLLGSHEERKRIRDYELFLQKEIFDGKEITLTPKIDSDVVHIQIDNEEKAIYDLGDGIQSIIILTLPMFLNKGKKVIFAIEEPELFLHPELQRKLIELMLDKDGKYEFENFQFFMTTHSNHFLDLILEEKDISVFSFKKNNLEEFKILKENTETVVTLMDELGVRNSSVFLANCTIWVEGITDRLYIRKIFEVWQKNKEQIKGFKMYKENIHFSFIEYSGGNITHWSFLDREEEPIEWAQISNKIFLIADNDGYELDEKTEKGKRLITLKNTLGNNFYCLEAKEIENTLSESVIKKIVNDYEKKSVEFTEELVQENYKQKNLGVYLNDIIKDRGRLTYKCGNTISDKRNFCNKAIEHIKNIEDLSNEQKILCEKIYAFVEESNT